MSKTHETLVADAKRAARRLARTRSDSYQACLDIVAQAAGRRNWSAFLLDPVDVRPHDEAADTGTEAPGGFADFHPGSGEGVVLGADGDRRLVRSARRSTVICIGAEAAGKTTGVVVPTIAASPQSSQLIHDLGGSILARVAEAGHRDHTRMVLLDPLGTMPAVGPGTERLAFNPLHPSCRLSGETPWEHAMRVALQLIPRRGDYFQEKSRLMLAAIMCHIIEVPGDIPPRPDGGERIASIPAVIDWIMGLFEGGDISHGFKRAIEVADAAGASGEILREFSAMVIMAPNERSGILGTIDQGLIVAKDKQMRQFLDPEQPERGAALVQAFEDADRPVTAFISGERWSSAVQSTISGMIVDTIGRRRAQLGPSHRSLQILLDEAAALPRIGVIGDALSDGAPAGISILAVFTNAQASKPTVEQHGGLSWMSAAAHSALDHVMVFGRPRTLALDRISTMIGQTVTPETLAGEQGQHAVCDDDGIRILATPFGQETNRA